MTKKELIDAMRDLNDDAEIHILCSLFDSGTDGYADDICFKDKAIGRSYGKWKRFKTA